MDGTERRRGLRARVTGTAACWSDEKCRGSYVIQNLSLGGIYISDGPALRAGEEFRVVLRLPSVRLAVRAIVLRCERRSREHAVALRFLRLNRIARQSIASTITEARTVVEPVPVHNDGPKVLVVHAGGLLQEALDREIRSMGREPISFSTALDAIDYLNCAGSEVNLALVDIHARSGFDLLAFLAAEWPAIRRIPIASHDERSAVAVAPDECVLGVPWQPADLARALIG